MKRAERLGIAFMAMIMNYGFVVQCRLAGQDPLVIDTKSGPVRGISAQAATGKPVSVWNSIPYAQPPVGALRFRHPQPIEPWQDVLDTSKKPNACWQVPFPHDESFGNVSGPNAWHPNTQISEDCLYLSVVTPDPLPRDAAAAAVIVWIHGGGFVAGSSTSDVYDPRILVSEENVVYVTMQYRLSVLGFLYLNSTEAPGNVGLFDQAIALQWIRNNIALFGGNPDNVTLFGNSAGAASVAMHLLSPISRHLFSQGILQAGSVTAPWAMRDKQAILKLGLQKAAILCPESCGSNNLTAAIECLRTVDARMLADLTDNQMFVPIIDGAFISESPVQSFNEGNYKKTNILVGSNSGEGFMWLYDSLPLVLGDEHLHVSDHEFQEQIENQLVSLALGGGENRRGRGIIKRAISFEYAGWTDQGDAISNLDALGEMFSDFFVTCSVNEFAQHYSNGGQNVYKYYFTPRSSVSPWPRWSRAVHGDEIMFVFGEPLNPAKGYLNEEVQLSKKMMRYWANFARTG